MKTESQVNQTPNHPIKMKPHNHPSNKPSGANELRKNQWQLGEAAYNSGDSLDSVLSEIKQLSKQEQEQFMSGYRHAHGIQRIKLSTPLRTSDIFSPILKSNGNPYAMTHPDFNASLDLIMRYKPTEAKLAALQASIERGKQMIANTKPSREQLAPLAQPIPHFTPTPHNGKAHETTLQQVITAMRSVTWQEWFAYLALACAIEACMAFIYQFITTTWTR